VSSDELTDIRSFNGFRSSPKGESMEGKYFAGNAQDASTWGRNFFYKSDGKPFHIIQFDIPEAEVVLFKIPSLDGIGSAWYADRGVPLEQINKFCSVIVELSALPL
jgi:hypothetical protein